MAIPIDPLDYGIGLLQLILSRKSARCLSETDCWSKNAGYQEAGKVKSEMIQKMALKLVRIKFVKHQIKGFESSGKRIE